MPRRSLAVAIALLIPVAASADAVDGTDGAVLAVLPFLHRGETNRIYVDVAPPDGRRRFRLLLDTGATHTVMTPGAARELGVTIRRQKRDPYRKKTLLGRDLQFYIDTDSSDTASRTGWEYALLGGNFLEHYVVELDFEHRQVRLIDPRRYEVPETVDSPDAAVVPLKIVSMRPTLALDVNGHRSQFLLDTGAPMGVSLSGATAKAGAVASKPFENYRTMGVFGEVAVELGVADRVRLGPFEFAPQPVEVHPNGFFNQGVSDDGIIGYDLLAQFRVRIDYPRQRLLLVRRSDTRITWHGREWNGWEDFLGLEGEAVRPGEEAPGSVAAAAPTTPAPSDLVPAREAEVAEERVSLELRAPEDGEHREGRLDWLEVRGWAGVGTQLLHDIAVVVDVSGSTIYASGTDIDGDGHVGKKRKRISPHRSFNPAHYSSDTDDTVLAAELLATRKLMEVLDPDRSRIGLISFADGARMHARVGTSAKDMGHALDDLARNLGSGATNIALATDTAIDALLTAGGEDRQKTILILSDGYPTAPGSQKLAAREAMIRAERAHAEGLRIYTFGLGLEAEEETDVYAGMAAVTGGEYLRLETPGEITNELPRINLADIASIALHNVTTGEKGQGVRVFPDGSFDGYVKLTPGENRLRVTAVGKAGGERSEERVVYFEPRELRDADEAEASEAELAAFEQKLALRAIETELAAEARRGREAAARQRGGLDVRAEESEGE